MWLRSWREREAALHFLDTPVERYIDETAILLGLELDPRWQPDIVANLSLLRDYAQLVTEFALAVEDEPAPVFTP